MTDITDSRRRTHRTARDAGTRFERQTADYLAHRLDDRIDRRPRNGTRDRGDIGGVRTPTGQRVVIECKDSARLALSAWIAEARIEADHDDAPIGIVVHKRRGTTAPGSQWVCMTLADLALLLGAPEADA